GGLQEGVSPDLGRGRDPRRLRVVLSFNRRRTTGWRRSRQWRRRRFRPRHRFFRRCWIVRAAAVVVWPVPPQPSPLHPSLTYPSPPQPAPCRLAALEHLRQDVRSARRSLLLLVPFTCPLVAHIRVRVQ